MPTRARGLVVLGAALTLASAGAANAEEAPVHAVGGHGTGAAGTLTIAAAVLDEGGASGLLLWRQRDGSVTRVTVDCGRVESFVGYGHSHTVYAGGVSEDGTRYYLSLHVAGDYGPPEARLGTQVDDRRPCGVGPATAWFAGAYVIDP